LGYGAKVARANHVHPIDISRADDANVIHINKTSELLALGTKTPKSNDRILIESAEDGTKKYVTIGSLPFKETLANQLTGAGVDGQIAIFNAGKLSGVDILSANHLPFNTQVIRIKANGIADVGATGYVADAGHIHPIDTSRAADSNVFHIDRANEFSQLTRKIIPNIDDMIVIESSTDSNAKRMIHLGALPFQTRLTNPISGKGLIGQIPMFVGENEIGGITINNAFNAPFETDSAKYKPAGIPFAGTNRTIAMSDHVHPANFSNITSQACIFDNEYVNNSGTPKIITITIQITADNNQNGVTVYVNRMLMMTYSTSIDATIPISFIVPSGMTYSVSKLGNASLINWVEIF